MCIVRRDKMCTSAYWCGSCPIRRRTRRIHLFVAESRPLHFPAVTKLWEHSECRRQLIHKTPNKMLNFETPQILVPSKQFPETYHRLHLDTHLTIHIHAPQYKVVKSFAQIWSNLWVWGCGPSTLWALGQVKIIWSCEAGSLSFLRFQN